MSERSAFERLKWKCRRGRLELDLVLAKFVPTLKEEDLAPFGALLDLPDDDLWDIVTGRSNAFPPRLNSIVARLRAV
jgi:antitoxin CptB